jgi:hypothetical protein
MIDFLRPQYNKIVNDLYRITNGNIIIGGSVSLKLQNVIDRDCNDADFDISKLDWETYSKDINKIFRTYKGDRFINTKLNFDFDIYTCLNSNKTAEFHLFVDNIPVEYNVITYNNTSYKCLDPSFMMKDKEWILETDSLNEKHRSDLASIKSWLNGK